MTFKELEEIYKETADWKLKDIQERYGYKPDFWGAVKEYFKLLEEDEQGLFNTIENNEQGELSKTKFNHFKKIFKIQNGENDDEISLNLTKTKEELENANYFGNICAKKLATEVEHNKILIEETAEQQLEINRLLNDVSKLEKINEEKDEVIKTQKKYLYITLATLLLFILFSVAL